MPISRRRLLAVAGSIATAGCATGDPQTGTSPTDTPTSSPKPRPEELTITAQPLTQMDQPVSVEISGANPGETVTIQSEVADEEGLTWRSKAVFETDDHGEVALDKAAPINGSYEGIDPMGWLWSMEPEREDGEFFTSFDQDTRAVTLRATTESQTSERELTRRLVADGVRERQVESDGLSGYLYEPPGEGPHPVILALHGSAGFPIRRRARLLASYGYRTFALEYFGNPPETPGNLVEVPLSYLDRAAQWLRDSQSAKDGGLGVVGVSRGGELALLLGARFDWVSVVVSWVGSGLVWQGSLRSDPAWSHDGEAVPYLTWKGDVRETEAGHTHFKPVVDRQLSDASEDQLQEAMIPVEETNGPVLLISGRDDQVWPSTRLSEFAFQRLENSDFEYDYAHLAYQNAGHYITPPYRPTTRRRVAGGYLMGGTSAGIAHAEADSWPRILDFLSKGFQSG